MAFDESLVEQIQNDILDPSVQLSSIMRKALVLAHKIKSDELKQWVERELRGYRGIGSEAPDYRRFKGQVLIDAGNGVYFYKNHPAPRLSKYPEIDKALEESVTCESIGELEALLKSGHGESGDLRLPLPAAFRNFITEHLGKTYYCMDAWVAFPPAIMAGVLDSVRTRLLVFTQEILDLSTDAKEIPALGRAEPAKISGIFNRCIMNMEKGSSQHIEGNQGCNIATGEARISSSTAKYESKGEMVRAVESLRSYMDSVQEAKRSDVGEAIAFLAQAIQTEHAPKAKVVLAAETISNSSDAMNRALRDISLGVTGSLIAAGIWEGVKYALAS